MFLQYREPLLEVLFSKNDNFQNQFHVKNCEGELFLVPSEVSTSVSLEHLPKGCWNLIYTSVLVITG